MKSGAYSDTPFLVVPAAPHQPINKSRIKKKKKKKKKIIIIAAVYKKYYTKVIYM
jgi:hypothetical protein